jgi:hypothetical protein
MSYKNLDIWKMANELVIDIHQMTLTLPKFEQFEVVQQIRRSSKTVKSTIVEGYGRRYYKADFIKFIIYPLASNESHQPPGSHLLDPASEYVAAIDHSPESGM